MSTLPARPLHPGDNLPVLGTKAQWSRDFALLGVLIGVLAPAVMWTWPMLGVSLSMLGGLLGGLSGPLFGRMLRWQADALRGRLPIWAIVGYMPLMGGLWGALTAGLGGLLVGGLTPLLLGEPSFALFAALYGGMVSAAVGGLVGATVVGLMWFPYTFLSVTRQRRWPIFAATANMAPLAAPLLAVLFGML
jgi:uncharacterized membrane protein YeaQ/YmgE (transglycosylase-associated protein family)